MNPESLLGSEATTAVPPSVWLSERPPAPARLQKFAARTSSLPFELSVHPSVSPSSVSALADVLAVLMFPSRLSARRPANGSRHCRQFAMAGMGPSFERLSHD